MFIDGIDGVPPQSLGNKASRRDSELFDCSKVRSNVTIGRRGVEMSFKRAPCEEQSEGQLMEGEQAILLRGAKKQSTAHDGFILLPMPPKKRQPLVTNRKGS